MKLYTEINGEEVSLSYSVNTDGDVEDMTVMFQGVDVTELLHYPTLDTLAEEAYKDYFAEAIEHNLSLAILARESSLGV